MLTHRKAVATAVGQEIFFLLLLNSRVQGYKAQDYNCLKFAAS